MPRIGKAGNYFEADRGHADAAKSFEGLLSKVKNDARNGKLGTSV